MKEYVFKICRLWILIFPLLFVACSDSGNDFETPVPEKPSTPQKPIDKSTELNETIDKFLKEYYLWNDEYKGMSTDLSIPYVDTYENFLQTTLMSMKTNTLDKKKSSNGEYILYSYIDRTEKKASSKAVYAGVNHGIEKDAKMKSFGISRLAIVSFIDPEGGATNEYGFAVQSVYPNSAASLMGIQRGSIIYEINKETITQSNYMTHYLDLLSPTASGITLLVEKDIETKPEEISLQATEIEHTPIIMNKVIEKGGQKIGYLVYDAFEAGYDNELLQVIADYKTTGITDLVLDFRYNGGGHLISSQMLSACIAGSKCKDKVFQYYRYNDTRMKDVARTKNQTGNEYDNGEKLFYDRFVYDNYYSINLDLYALNLNRLYVLTSPSTASASEVLISSLRGIGMDVILIGEHTNGKNVGMEVKDFDLDGYSYELAPITFQIYNAQKESVPETGLTVEYKISDWDSEKGYTNFGEEHEPLLAKALGLITQSSSAKAEARSTLVSRLKQSSLRLPSVPSPRSQGTLVIR